MRAQETLDHKQRYMNQWKPLSSNESTIIGLAVIRIKNRSDLIRLKADLKAMEEAIDVAFNEVKVPKSWGMLRVIWLKEVVLNTLCPEATGGWNKLKGLK